MSPTTATDTTTETGAVAAPTAVPAVAPNRPAPRGRVAQLAAQAADAAEVRALTTHPDVIALRVEKVRSQVDMLLWVGIVLGLAFTMVNVQAFAAAGAPVYSGAWWVAWLLDPMVSIVLLAVLRAEQVTARYQVALPAWARRTKWLTFAATYVMNTWTSWGLDGRPLSWSGVVLHSVPPLVVFAAAETGPGLRDRLTEAVHRAGIDHADTDDAGIDHAACGPTRAASITVPRSVQPEPFSVQPPPAVHSLTGGAVQSSPADVVQRSVPVFESVARPASAEQADRRSGSSPARDRARAAASRHAHRHGRLPTVSELEAAAQVSRGTAAAVLKTLREQPTPLHLVTTPGPAGTSEDDPTIEEHAQP